MSNAELGDVRRIVVLDAGDGLFVWQYQREDGFALLDGKGTREEVLAALQNEETAAFFAHGGMVITPDGF